MGMVSGRSITVKGKIGENLIQDSRSCRGGPLPGKYCEAKVYVYLSVQNHPKIFILNRTKPLAAPVAIGGSGDCKTKLHHGHLSHADGNGDWVLTISTALSLVVFDHDGLNFRHTLYPSYKSHRPPTPDTIVQGLQYLKASIKAMSIKVIEVRVVSPDKDFFQILSPSLRLLRIAPRGMGLVSFGMEDFAKKYGSLQPSQFVDVMSLMGDESDNIPGSLENLLAQVDQVEEERFRKDNGEKFTSLLTAISAYAEGFSADPIIRRAIYLWKKLEKT
ncbi:hypothetical protein Vadar_020563 [Vaccinium darrowii]|uniref:Uncharacterized protein n=1 Tax=Vaccinium darrowii TaxID=229202 RepID=A0ACB7YX05_9ERIC|nr:hypothetical protein Vadar_020563 [Vaccinium darrowii]